MPRLCRTVFEARHHTRIIPTIHSLVSGTQVTGAAYILVVICEMKWPLQRHLRLPIYCIVWSVSKC